MPVNAKRIPLGQAPAIADAQRAREDEERRYMMRHERLRRLHLRQRDEQRARAWWPDDDADEIEEPCGGGWR